MPANQAAAVAEGVVDLVLANCTSKSDLRAMGAELRAEISVLRAEMHGSVETLRGEMHGRILETNGRIDLLRSAMNSGFEAVAAEFALLRTELDAMQNRIVVRLGVFIGAFAAAVAAVATIF